MHDHLNVHPRAEARINFFRCGGQAVFEVFEYNAEGQRTAEPLNSDVGGHHIALYVDNLDDAVDLSPPPAGRQSPRVSQRSAKVLIWASAGSISSRHGECSSNWSLHPSRKGVLSGQEESQPTSRERLPSAAHP